MDCSGPKGMQCKMSKGNERCVSAGDLLHTSVWIKFAFFDPWVDIGSVYSADCFKGVPHP